MEKLSEKSTPYELYIHGVKSEERRKRRRRMLLILSVGLILGTGYTVLSSIGKGAELRYEKVDKEDLTIRVVRKLLSGGNVKIIVHDFDRGSVDTIDSAEGYLNLLRSDELNTSMLVSFDKNRLKFEGEESLQPFDLEIIGEKKEGDVLSIIISNYDPNIDYELDYGNGVVQEAKEINLYIYKKAGIYDLVLTATDKNMRKSTSYKRLHILRDGPGMNAGIGGWVNTNWNETASSPDLENGMSDTEVKLQVLPSQQLPPKPSPRVASSDNPPPSFKTGPTKKAEKYIAPAQQAKTSVSKAPDDFSKHSEPLPDLPEEGFDSFDGDVFSQKKEIKTKDDRKAKKAIQKPLINDQIPLITAEHLPAFPGGEKAMYKFLNERIRYPQQARDFEIEGKVYIQFVVNPKGKITEPKLVKSLGYGCDEEAMRIVKLMPKWTPGEQNGLPVSVIYTLPVSFKLK